MSRSRRSHAFVVAVALVGSLAGPALVPAAAGAAPRRAARVAGAPLIDPGAIGPDAVDELAYDFGDEAFQPQGFPAKVELRAKVYAPQVIAGQAPLVILQHGRHVTCANATDQTLEWPCPAGLPEVPSYQGYDALGRTLASQGMVVVSIGANGINANDGYLKDGGASARAQLILEHLRRWQAWSTSATGSPFGARFVGHVDLGDVGLMGHSRGGEGIAAAVQLNQRIGSPFGIKAALALAPVDFGRRVIGGVDLGVILPYCDGDVSDLQGASYYDDGRYASPGDPHAKLSALLYGANHNFFNTVWTTGPGSGDDTAFFGAIDATPSAASTDPCAPGGASRLTAAQQEQAGATLMAGFFRRYLGPEPALQRFVTGTAPYPASSGPARWSIAFHAPDRLDVESWAAATTYRSNRFGQLAGVIGLSSGLQCNPFAHDTEFGGPIPDDVTTTTCPSQAGFAAVDDTGVLDAGWVGPGSFVREPLDPAGVDVTGYDSLRLRVSVPQDARNRARAVQDFSVVLEDFDGARTSVAVSTGTNGLARMNPGRVQHALLNGVRISLSAFSTIDLTRVKAVELRFDRTDAGRLTVADLAFTQESVGDAPANTTGVVGLSSPTPMCRKSNAARWACALVHLAWGRDPSSAEITTIASGYTTAASRRTAIGRVLASAEARVLAGEQYAETYVQADLDAEAVRSIIDPARAGTWDGDVVALTDGLVYSSGSISSGKQIVRSAYLSIVGRPADPGGLAYWAPRVDAGGAAKLATSLVRTSTYAGRVVDERYQQIVGHRPDAAGRAYWVAKVARPGGEQALVTSLLATEAFRTIATR